MHRCKVFNASSSFLFAEATISIAGYLLLDSLLCWLLLRVWLAGRGRACCCCIRREARTGKACRCELLSCEHVGCIGVLEGLRVRLALTCDEGLGKLLGLLLLLLKGSGQCLGLGHRWHHLLGGVSSRVLAVHVKEGVAGSTLQTRELHDVRTQPIRRLLLCGGGGVELLKVGVAGGGSNWLPGSKRFHAFPLKSYL